MKYRYKKSQLFYAILGVPPDASKSEIKSAYRQLKPEYHPDKYSGDPEKMTLAAKDFDMLTNITDILLASQKRDRYDFFGLPGFSREYEDAKIPQHTEEYCSLCEKKLKNPVTLPCLDVFCFKCICVYFTVSHEDAISICQKCEHEFGFVVIGDHHQIQHNKVVSAVCLFGYLGSNAFLFKNDVGEHNENNIDDLLAKEYSIEAAQPFQCDKKFGLNFFKENVEVGSLGLVFKHPELFYNETVDLDEQDETVEGDKALVVYKPVNKPFDDIGED